MGLYLPFYFECTLKCRGCVLISPQQQEQEHTALPEQHLGARQGDRACTAAGIVVVLLLIALCFKECNRPQEQISEEKLRLCRSSHCFPFLFIFLSRPTRGSEQNSESVPAPCPHPEPEHCFALLGHPYEHHMLPLCFLLTCGASRS